MVSVEGRLSQKQPQEYFKEEERKRQEAKFPKN